jgi:class 3 adenylate cyclase/tetratricopeptide (TPR) repeat protein
VWLSLLPHRVLRLPARAFGAGERFHAAVLIADVCGFTALSEAVAGSGPAGTERLSRAVNDVFTPLVALVHDHDGEVANFLGDAMVAVFPTGAAALRCAGEVHNRVGGPMPLELSVGVAAGPLVSTVVGDPARRLEHVLIGGVLARAAAAEGQAGPGRTVAEPDVSAFAGGLPRRVPPLEPGSALVRPFLHASIAARLEAGRDRLLDEHRRVTSLFCRFEELREDDPGAPARLQRIVTAALDVLDGYDGSLLQVELVDKGSTLKATFGAPLAHDDDPRRATACARALLGRPEFAEAAVGVSTGTVLSGLIGCAARREYTVLGDAVNVAARLMVRARPGEILVDDATRVAADANWGWKPAGSLALKGRAGSVPAFTPTRAAVPVPPPARPFVGRERELATAAQVLDRSGAVLAISGEAGIGKSRLLDALAAAARARGVTVLRGAGEPYGRDFAYGAWRPLARELIGDVPALGDHAPLAAALLGRTMPETRATERLSPEARAEALQHLIVECVRRRRQAGPLLLAFEDCHWLDDPSRELIERVARQCEELRVVVVVTFRTGEARDARRIPGLPGAVALALEGLAPRALERLVPAALADAVIARCGGNPLFAEELVRFAREREGDVALPDNLRAVVTARLDTLDEQQRAALRIASVIGRTFDPAWLAGCDPALGGLDAVEHTLGTLARLDIVRSEGAVRAFKHAVTRDVAYETLALAAREHLHQAVASYVERTSDLERPDVLELLAHHYGRTLDEGKQRIYFRRAGDAARGAFANEAAIRHYRALAPLLSGAAAIDASLDLGAVLQLTGEWAEAESLYSDALATAERLGLAGAGARAQAALGGLLTFNSAYPAAVDRLEAARASFAALGERERLAGVLEPLAHTYFLQGDDERANVCAREHLRLARELGDVSAQSSAMDMLGLVLWHRGELARAREQLEEALALVRRAEDRIGIIHRLNDLAGLLDALDLPREAIARLGEAYTLARETGYRRLAHVVVGNAAELFLQAGDDDAALGCAGVALEVAATLRDVIALLHSAAVIAEVRGRQGDVAVASRLLTLVADVARAAGNRRYLEEAERLHALVGHDPHVEPAVVALDPTPFLAGRGAPDPDALARSAEVALREWIRANDVR